MLQLSSGPWVLLCHESILRITYLRVYLAFVTFSPSKRRMFRNRLGVWPRIAPLLDIHGLAATVTLVLNVPNRLSDTG